MDHDVPFLVALIDVSVGFDDLVEGVAAVDGGLERARLSERSEREEVLYALAGGA